MARMCAASALREPPGPRGYPVVGILPRIWRDPLRFFSEVAREHGPLARIGLGRFTLYLLSAPALIEEVLQDPGERFWKGKGLRAAEEVMGQGLATSEGPPWLRARRLLGPAFQPQRLQALVPVVQSAADELFAGWAPGQELDAAAATNHLVQRVIFRTMLGADLLPGEAERLGAGVVEANAWINHAAWRLLPLPDGFPTPRRRRFERALRDLDGAIYRVIGQRRRDPDAGRPDDLLGRLLSARDEAGAGLDDRQVRDEVMTQFVAGHETTSSALAFTLHLLATHPAVQDALAEELAAGADPTALPALERALLESMRVYPPSWVIVRTPYKDDALGGYALPQGAPLLISQWVVHRHPELWPDPERFDPERWLPERSQGRPRCAYFPFGGGRRICIGNHFALLVLKTILGRLLPRFRLTPTADHRLVPEPTTTLRAKYGVRVRLERR